MLTAEGVFGSRQGFCEKVCKHVGGGNINRRDGLISHLLPDPMILVFEVLGSGLEQWVLLKGY